MYAVSKFTLRYVYLRHAGNWWRIPNEPGGWERRRRMRNLPADASNLGALAPAATRILGVPS